MARANFNHQQPSYQPPEVRITNFQEVRLGLSYGQAIAEASRCLNCIKRNCVRGCPIGNDIPHFIEAIKKEQFQEAIKIIRKTNPLPGITSRVCPRQEHCEGSCVLHKRSSAIAIADLERFAADWERANISSREKALSKPPPTGKKVAISRQVASSLSADK